MTQLILNVCELFISESTCTGPPPAVDKTPMLLIINALPATPKIPPPKAEQMPVIAQSDAIVCFKLTLACTQLLICVWTFPVNDVKYGKLYFVIALLKDVLLYETKALEEL